MTETTNHQETKTVRNLEPQHLKHLSESGLTAQTIAASGIYTITDPEEAAAILGWKGTAPVPSIAFPHFDAEGATYFCVLRPDTPFLRKKGKAPKYESPLHQPPRIYLPPMGLVPTETWADPEKPIIVVEGIKKALAAVQSGVPAISAQGVSVWHDIAFRKETELWELHPDFKNIPVKGRIIYVAFDGRDTEHNPPVILAEARLASMLVAAGADVRLLRIPYSGAEKVGLDDYLTQQDEPKTALQKLLEEAITGDFWKSILATEEAADPMTAALQLLRDKSFAASYRCADSATQDAVQHKLKKIANVSKKSVDEAVDAFFRLFVQRGVDVPEVHDDIDPNIYQEAEALLCDPRLDDKLMAHFKAEGLVGEETAAQTILLAGVSRMLLKPINLVVKAASSSGKNFTVNCVTRCFPQDDVKEITDMSPKALMYLETGIKHKIVVISEAEGTEKAEYPMRIAMSEGRLCTIVTEKNEEGRFVAREHVVEGPACFITTTTRGKLHDENETRLLEINLDESEEQTKRIIDAQAVAASTPISTDDRETLMYNREIVREALGILKPYSVRIPQAQEMARKLPPNQVRRRRDFTKMLSVASAHTLLHQKQRVVDNNTVIATDADIQTAELLCGPLLHQIPPNLEKLLEALGKKFGDELFTSKDAGVLMGQSTDAMGKRLRELNQCELVEIIVESRGNKATKWRVVPSPRLLVDNTRSEETPTTTTATKQITAPLEFIETADSVEEICPITKVAMMRQDLEAKDASDQILTDKGQVIPF